MGRPKEFRFLYYSGLHTGQSSQHHAGQLVSFNISDIGGAKELGMVHFRNQKVPKISQITGYFIEFVVFLQVFPDCYRLQRELDMGIRFVTYFTTEMT